MRAFVAAATSGLLFGCGLVFSDMINPARILGFLDVAGDWDPSLALVMAGALIPASLAYFIRRRLQRPALDLKFHEPTSRAIDGRLVLGAIIFGAGWGLVGFCPGPAIAAFGLQSMPAFIFGAAMLLGMTVYRFTMDRLQSNSAIR